MLIAVRRIDAAKSSFFFKLEEFIIVSIVSLLYQERIHTPA